MNRLDRRVTALENPKGLEKPPRLILINPDEPGSEERAREEAANVAPGERVILVEMVSLSRDRGRKDSPVTRP